MCIPTSKPLRRHRRERTPPGLIRPTWCPVHTFVPMGVFLNCVFSSHSNSLD